MNLTDGQSVSIAANANVVNILSGRIVEFLKSASVARLAAVADAAGLQLTFQSGDRVVVQPGFPLHVAEGAGQGPREPEDIVFDGQAFAMGDRLLLSIFNTTAGAIVMRYALKLVG